MKYKIRNKIINITSVVIICIIFFSLGLLVGNKSLIQRKIDVKDYKNKMINVDVHKLIKQEYVYNLTEVQKEEAHKKIRDFIEINNLQNLSQQKAIKIAAEIINSSISYDDGHTYKTGLDAIYYGEGDCVAMADLFSTIMDELKIESYVVPIYLNVPDKILYYAEDEIWERIKSSGHAINMVKVDSEYMFIDSCWGIGLMSEEDFSKHERYLKSYFTNDGENEYIFKYKIGQTFYNIMKDSP